MYNDSNINEHMEDVKLSLLKFGWQWQYEIDDCLSIENCFQNYKTKEIRKTFYVREKYRNQNIWKKFNLQKQQYITFKECGLVDFFNKSKVDYLLLEENNIELDLIKKYYGSRKAKRSNISYINHIHEGCGILYLLDATDIAMKAFMLHPIYQNGDNTNNTSIDMHVINMAKDYALIANKCLRHNYKQTHYTVLEEYLECNSIKNMLIADKIQNYKDFKNNIKKYFERRDIEEYFMWWFDTLNISHRFLNKAIDYITL